MDTPTTPRDVLEHRVPRRIEQSPQLRTDIDAVIVFDITGPDGGTWLVDLTRDTDWVSTDTTGAQPTTTVRVSDDDFIALVDKQLSPQAAAMTGRLRLTPMNARLAMKIGRLLR